MQNYKPQEIQQIRQYGIDDLKNYTKKLKKNIKVFKDAIAKEKKEITKTQTMIKVLKQDQKVQREIQLQLKRPEKRD